MEDLKKLCRLMLRILEPSRFDRLRLPLLAVWTYLVTFRNVSVPIVISASTRIIERGADLRLSFVGGPHVSS